MGIDVHGLNFLRYAARLSGGLGDALMLGRQQVHIPTRALGAFAGFALKPGDYAEGLLQASLGATSVESLDASAYEGATHVADLNAPVTLAKAYDAVIDFGTCEHVFNVAAALANVDGFCRDGGQILHVLPANNLCGHGFWQFSAELFFSLYADANGFARTEVFYMDLARTDAWWRVTHPQGQARVMVESATPVYVACRTVKRRAGGAKSVQQSDYLPMWDGAGAQAGPHKGRSLGQRLRRALPKAWRVDATRTLSPRHPYLTKVRPADLIAG